MNGKKKIACTVIFLVAGMACAGAQDREVSLGGYFKNNVLVMDLPRIVDVQGLESDELYGTNESLIRLRGFYRPGKRVAFEAAYESLLRISEPDLNAALSLTEPDVATWRVADPDADVYQGDKDSNVRLLHNIDRLNATISLDMADISIGRQAVAFGSARSVNPMDVFSPFGSQNLNQEEKDGVDALRVRIPIQDMGEVDAGAVLGHDAERKNNAFFLRTKVYALATDFTLIAMDFRDNLLVGADVTRSMGGAGFRAEGAYVFAGGAGNRQPDDDYFRMTVGVDYSFRPGVYGFAEYHFNGPGTVRSSEFLENSTQTAYREGGVYLLGRHYLIPGMSWEITPLWVSTTQVMVNLSDPSCLLSPVIDYNIREDIYLSAGAFVSLGDEGTVVSLPAAGGSWFEPESEFGMYADMFYMQVKIYF